LISNVRSQGTQAEARDYRFMGTDANSADNRALREAMEDRSPVVYFHAVAPSVYQAISPVFVTQWDVQRLTVHVTPGEEIRGSPILPDSADTGRYIAVATMKTGEVFSCIQERNEPKTREDVPPSVLPELRLPAKPFSNSSIQSTQGAMASADWMTERWFDSDWPTKPAKIRRRRRWRWLRG
jgi:hypothetical protein